MCCLFGRCSNHGFNPISKSSSNCYDTQTRFRTWFRSPFIFSTAFFYLRASKNMSTFKTVNVYFINLSLSTEINNTFIIITHIEVKFALPINDVYIYYHACSCFHSLASRWRYLRRCIACWPEIVKCFLVCFLDIYDFVSSHTSLFIPATEFSAPRVFFRILSWFTFHNSLIPCSIHWFFFLHFTRPPDKKKITMNQCNRNRYFCVFVHFIYVFYVHTIDLPQKKWFRCEHENRLINSV